MTTLVHLSSRKERNSFDYKHSSLLTNELCWSLDTQSRYGLFLENKLSLDNWLQFAFCISGVLVEAFFGKKKNFSQKVICTLSLSLYIFTTFPRFFFQLQHTDAASPPFLFVHSCQLLLLLRGSPRGNSCKFSSCLFSHVSSMSFIPSNHFCLPSKLCSTELAFFPPLLQTKLFQSINLFSYRTLKSC